MTTRWDAFGYGPWPSDREVPQDAPDAATRRRLGLPATLRPVPGAVQRPVFDPALVQHTRAMRAGEPRFASAEQEGRWYAARRRAVDHVLAAIAGSPWAENLMLRGSVLLRAWYGEAAREPGDLDFVVLPSSWSMPDGRTRRMMDGIAATADHVSRDDDVRVRADGAVVEDIWTYDRVPGCRLLLHWKTEGLPRGMVQLDFVFGEEAPLPPEPTLVPRADGGEPVLLNAATPEMSLAWKVLWLATDPYPQGKDLYDAWLLSRHVTLWYELLDDTFAAAGVGQPDLSHVLGCDVEWGEFLKEYPDVPGDADDYLRALAEALAPVFAQAPPWRE